jgi:hypothetical protein
MDIPTVHSVVSLLREPLWSLSSLELDHASAMVFGLQLPLVFQKILSPGNLAQMS